MSDYTELFLTNNIDIIDQDGWKSFFESFWEDVPCHVTHKTAIEIFKILKEAGIEWPEDLRQEVLIEGVENILDNVYQAGMDIDVRNTLYVFDEDNWADGASNWLGYTEDEFVDIVYKHRDKLPVEYSYGTKEVLVILR